MYWPTKKKSPSRIEVDVRDTNTHTQLSESEVFMHAKDKADPIPLALKQKQIRRGFVLQVDCVCVDPGQTLVRKCI